MTLQQLRVLVAIVDNGSFSAAALELGVGQSSISYTIAELEEELGLRLIARGRFGAIPTDAGRRVVAHARHVLELTEAIRQEASLEHGDLRGRLRVATFRSVGTKILPGVVAELTMRHPGLVISIHETTGTPGSMDELLFEGLVDVAFAQPEMAQNAVFWPLLRDPYLAVLPSDTYRHVSRVQLQALADRPFVLAGIEQACVQPVVRAMQAIQPSFRPAFEVREDSIVLSMVAQGLGVSIVPSLAIDAVPAEVRVVELAEPLERTIGIALLPSSLKVPAVRSFLTTLRHRFPQSDIPPLPAREADVPAT